MPANDKCDPKKASEVSALGDSGSIALSGSVQILTLLGASVTTPLGLALTAVGAGGTVLLGAWQMEQQKKFIEKITQEISNIDSKKLDKEVLESSEFKEIVVRIYTEAGLASSHKQSTFAKGLVNSALYPNSKLTGKLIFIRIVAQLSDEELQILEVMQNAWMDNVPFLGKDSIQESLLDLDIKQIQLACQGLIQQNVLESINPDVWGLSILGRQLAAWLSGKEEQGDFENQQKIYRSEFKKVIDGNMRELGKEIEENASKKVYDILHKINRI
jgi:hypothetical protein